MPAFPSEKIRGLRAILGGEPGNASLEIPLAPFDLSGEKIDTSIRLEGIDLPTVAVADLMGQTFSFPVNPKEGYIDGSVYIENAHHPMDVTKLSFKKGANGGTAVRIVGKLLVEVEGLDDFQNTDIELEAPINGE